MDFLDKQIAPPRSWEKFEELTRALFAAIWSDPLAQRHGRSGQRQFGVDVFGTPAHALGKTHGVQCKGKDGSYRSAATTDEFDAELAKAELFNPPLSHWTFATTAPNDAPLQRHAQAVCEQRVAAGLFPVVAIGWETIQALMSEQPAVIEAFYPEHGSSLHQIISMLKGMPTAGQLYALNESLKGASVNAAPPASAFDWLEVRFDVQRDLGPALMGRPLGPADVAACPPLPEVSSLLDDLTRAGSARLSGVAGAGKSICALQAARILQQQGWRVMRLPDPTGGIPAFGSDASPTLYLIDDAHLAHPGQLRALEQATHATRRLLSTHTSLDGKSSAPGTIHLDAKRAVKVIADGLRDAPEGTLAAVRAADDRVGTRIGDESLEQRLQQAETAEFPWQFCFILGGGWRRAKSMADSARAARADLVLAAAAIRQLASRDAPGSSAKLSDLLGEDVTSDQLRSALTWLIGQRLLLSDTDLRCPHQRLAGVLLNRILEGQAPEGRALIARMLHSALNDAKMPLGGLALLLRELHYSGDHARWTRLVAPEMLASALTRAWGATTAADIRESCWFLQEASSYLGEDRQDIENHKRIMAAWIDAAPEGACYSIRGVLNQIQNRNEATVAEILTLVSPAKLARTISTAPALHASEVADMLSTARPWLNPAWNAEYLANLDRDACLGLMATWPADAWLSAAASYCQHFCYADQDFGFILIETLIPAIATRIRADPPYAFHELDDIVWHSLRLYDPLGVYVGKLAPTKRMRHVGRQIARCWSAPDLAAKLSGSTQRTFQSAAGVLSFVEKVAPKKFKETVLALDWDAIDATIGADWAENIGDARQVLGVAWAVPAARAAIKALIVRNEHRITKLSTQLALMSPETAVRIVEVGKTVSIVHHGHVDWMRGALVAARMAQARPDLVPKLLAQQYAGMAGNLSQPSPSFWHEGSFLIAFIAERHPEGLAQILGALDVTKTEQGWRNALQGSEVSGRPGRKSKAHEVAALLIHHAIARDDAIGELARKLRCQYPKRSTPPSELLEPIDLSEPL